MKNKIVLTLASLAFASVATAGDDGFKISGDIATSIFSESGKGYNGAFPGAAGAINAGAAAGLASGDNTENNGDFSVDMVEIQLEKSMGNSGVVLGIGYGRLFQGINSYSDAVSTSTFGATTLPTSRATLNLTNAYFHHKLGDTGLSFKLGRFAANLGFESYNYMNNMNYARSYGFQLLNPFFFTGVAADYTVNEMVSVGLVVANSTLNSDISENESKVMGVNATVKPMEGLVVKLNYLTSREDQTSGIGGTVAAGTTETSDVTRLNASATYTLNSMYDFAVSYNSLTAESEESAAPDVDGSMSSIALYAGAKMEMWGAGLRYEMFDDGDGMLTTVDNAHDTITLTGWYNVDQNAVLKLEIAQTSADKQVFVDDNFAADDSMMAYGLGFMYRF